MTEQEIQEYKEIIAENKAKINKLEKANYELKKIIQPFTRPYNLEGFSDFEYTLVIPDVLLKDLETVKNGVDFLNRTNNDLGVIYGELVTDKYSFTFNVKLKNVSHSFKNVKMSDDCKRLIFEVHFVNNDLGEMAYNMLKIDKAIFGLRFTDGKIITIDIIKKDLN